MIELPQDAEVRVYHYRPAEGEMPHLLLTRHELKSRGMVPAPKGGVTDVFVKFGDGRWAVGTSQCSPRDNFSRSKGRLIATGRAMSNIEKRYPS